jgi:hypothetical protein
MGGKRGTRVRRMLREQQHGEAGLRSALWAGIVSCGVPLAIGAATGWSLLKIASYGVLALLFICLTQCQSWPPAWREPIRAPLWRYLLLMGTLGFGLQLLSADPFIQPIVFTIPLVDAALRYDGRRTALVGAATSF